VHALSALPAHYRARACTNSSTSGVAAWTDAEGALCRATLELIERDAFLRAWLARRAPPRIALRSLPGDARRSIARLQAAGCDVSVSRLDAPVPVFSVYLREDKRPFAAITAAAALDPDAALAKALDEAEGRLAHAVAFPAEPLQRASDVQGTHDVHRFYQTRRFFRNADFWRRGPASSTFAEDPECRDWHALKTWLADRGLDLLAVDLTPEGAALDQGRRPLVVMRAFVPGLLPIWFQHGLQPAGLPAFQAALGQRGPRGNAAFVHPFT
jgi:ribosomal protein S12 methylthiotransferase accessory factor